MWSNRGRSTSTAVSGRLEYVSRPQSARNRLAGEVGVEIEFGQLSGERLERDMRVGEDLLASDAELGEAQELESLMPR